jgi:phosphate transport system permease protein
VDGPGVTTPPSRSPAPAPAAPDAGGHQPRYGEKAIKAALPVRGGVGGGHHGHRLLAGPAHVSFFREVRSGVPHRHPWAPALRQRRASACCPSWSAPSWSSSRAAVAIPVGLLSAIYLSEYAPAGSARSSSPRSRSSRASPPWPSACSPSGSCARWPRTSSRSCPGGPVLDRRRRRRRRPAHRAAGQLGLRRRDAGRARRLREGAYALGASKLKVSTRVVFPAAISGIVAAIVLAALAGHRRDDGRAHRRRRRQPQLSFDPFPKGVQTMTAYIGGATGDISGGHPRVRHDLRRRHACSS